MVGLSVGVHMMCMLAVPAVCLIYYARNYKFTWKNFIWANLITLGILIVVFKIIFPLIIGLGLVAQPLLTSLLGEQWQSAASLLSVLCIGYMLYPVHSINLNLLQVMGRSDLFLKLERPITKYIFSELLPL
mgnify:CR=1 FL=1